MDEEFKNEITDESVEKRDNLQDTFSAAYDFLMWIESLESDSFHIGTVKNINVYYKNSLLFYMVIDSRNTITIFSKTKIHR